MKIKHNAKLTWWRYLLGLFWGEIEGSYDSEPTDKDKKKK